MIRDTRCELRGVSISITKFTELWWNDGVFEGSEEHWKLWRCEVEIFCFLKRFFTMLCFVQNDTVLFCTQELEIWTISVFKRKDFFILIMFLREQSWRNSFALKRWGNWCGMRCEMRVFLSQSSLRWGEMMAFLRALRNIGDVLGSAQVFQFMYVEKNLFYYKEILHFATLRSEWQSFGL